MWVRTILISGPPRRLLDKAGEGSTFREMRQLATWILWSLKSAALLILTEEKKDRNVRKNLQSYHEICCQLHWKMSGLHQHVFKWDLKASHLHHHTGVTLKQSLNAPLHSSGFTDVHERLQLVPAIRRGIRLALMCSTNSRVYQPAEAEL